MLFSGQTCWADLCFFTNVQLFTFKKTFLEFISTILGWMKVTLPSGPKFKKFSISRYFATWWNFLNSRFLILSTSRKWNVLFPFDLLVERKDPWMYNDFLRQIYWNEIARVAKRFLALIRDTMEHFKIQIFSTYYILKISSKWCLMQT